MNKLHGRTNMGTNLQKKLAEAIVENMASDNPLNKGELLESVGYAKSVAEAKPTEILQQKGVLEELEILGFNERRAKEVVGGILNDVNIEPSTRLKAADMIFKVHGFYEADEQKKTPPMLVLVKFLNNEDERDNNGITK